MASPSIPIPGAVRPPPDDLDGSLDGAGGGSDSDTSSDASSGGNGRGDVAAAAAGGMPPAVGSRRSTGRPPRPPASPDEVTAAAAATAAAMNDGLSLLAAASADADGGGREEPPAVAAAAAGGGGDGGRVDAAAAAAAAVALDAHFHALCRGAAAATAAHPEGSSDTLDAPVSGVAAGGCTATSPPFPQVTRLVLTGGPCAGKTTALATLSERLRARGFAVYVVPEAATIFWTGGASLAGASAAQVAVFQASLLRVQLALEDAFVALARAGGRPAVLLADRGALDGRAYMGARAWDAMMQAGGWSTAALRDGRYDGIVHLVTAADGAVTAYGSGTNATRVETPAEAVALDAKLRACWVGHPALRVVDNQGGGGFAAKMERVYRVVCGMVGVPASATCRRKFLVVREGGVPLSAMAGVADFDVIQTFLSPLSAGNGVAAGVASSATAADGGGAWQESVRQRGRDGYYTFVHKVRRAAAPAAGDPPGAHAVEELKRAVGNRDYLSLLARADPSRRSVRLRRRCFLHAANYYVLDAIERPAGEPPLLLLRVAVEGGGGDVVGVGTSVAGGGEGEGRHDAPPRLELPPWLHVGAEVTGDPAYSVYELSRRLGRERRLFAGRPLKGGGGGSGGLDLGTSV